MPQPKPLEREALEDALIKMLGYEWPLYLKDKEKVRELADFIERREQTASLNEVNKEVSVLTDKELKEALYNLPFLQGPITTESVDMEKLADFVAEREKAILEDVRKWVAYNKHDMGELGEFIRTQYVYNKLDELEGRGDA